MRLHSYHGRSKSWILQDDEGYYYRLRDKALTQGFKLMTEGKLHENALSKAFITFSMLMSMMAASGQNSDKVVDKVKTSNKEVKLTSDQLESLNDETGINWSKKLGDKLFIYNPNKKTTDREFLDLNLGPYNGDLGVAKVTHRNKQVDGDLEYTVDINDKRYLKSDIFKKIKEFNQDLKGVEINFTYRGTPLNTYKIKL